ncbi:hypothetical protein AGMMS50218_16900 [Actinomycetota bacterium]|nr:hypothetical protein AGMMS50218_16900 [Actinomycetota bacterium]
MTPVRPDRARTDPTDRPESKVPDRMAADSSHDLALARGTSSTSRSRLARLHQQIGLSLRPTWVEAAWVALVLVAIQALMFSGYYRGLRSPSGDFLASYNTEAFSWWRDGGMLNPQAWVPFTWGGFPAAAQVQNGSWYLPTGLMSLLTPYDISAAAVQQALHVTIAGLGIYLLARRAGFGRLAATFGLVAYSFTTGFFTEAPYIDIVRGFALMPWIVLCLSPLWPWRRWQWSVPVAALLLWQAAVGIYPGVLVATAYSALAWVIGWQVSRRLPLRQFLLPLAAAGVLAVLLSLPKFLPQLGLNTIGRGAVQDLTVVTPTTLATLVLPGFPGMPGVYSLNLLFVPAAALLMALLVSLDRPATRLAVVTFVVALLLAVPHGPVRAITAVLPGADASRFRLNDYLPVLFTAGTLAAVSGIERLHRWNSTRMRDRHLPIRLTLLVVPLALAGVMLVLREGFRTGDWRPTTIVLASTTALAVAVALVPPDRLRPATWRWVSTGSLAVLAVVSGATHADTVRSLWDVDTVAAQQSLWGETSGDLIEHRVLQVGAQRPARLPLVGPTGAGPDESTHYNSGFYTGIATVGGYFSVHQSASYVEAGAAMTDPATADDARALWASAGVLIPADTTASGVPAAAQVAQCASTGDCAGLTVVPVDYSAGNLLYQVSSPTSRRVIANEAYYRGWQVLLTGDDARSLAVEPQLGPAGTVAFDLPAGSWRVSLVYRTPLEQPARFAFGVGVVGLLVPIVVGVLRRRRSGTRGRTAP